MTPGISLHTPSSASPHGLAVLLSLALTVCTPDSGGDDEDGSIGGPTDDESIGSESTTTGASDMGSTATSREGETAGTGVTETRGTDGTSGGSTSISEPSTTSEATGGISDVYAEDIAIAVHDDVNTILVVTWEQQQAADRVWLEFSFEGGSAMTSRPRSGEAGSHRDVVLGVPGETEVSISVVSEVGGTLYKTTPQTGVTEAVPASMPKPTVMDYDPDRASPQQWLFGAVEDSGDDVANNLNSYLTYQAWLYILDRQGRVVWYYNDPSRNSPSGFPRVARDGEYIVFEESRVGSQGRIIKMTLDREYFEIIDLPGLADAIDVTDDGSLLFDRGNSGELHELTADGTDRTLWDCGTELALTPNCYSNTVNWNPVEDSIFMSFPEPGVVVEIDRQSGEMIGHYGNQPGAWEFAPPLETPPAQWRFGFQHFPNLTPSGTLILSSHMPGYEDFNQAPTPYQHAFVEFSIDRQTQTLTEVWRYTEGPEWPRARGMALRLENGNTLANYGTAGVIREVTPTKDTVFYVKFDIPEGDDNYNKLVGHNVLVDDLYGLNGGPQ